MDFEQSAADKALPGLFSEINRLKWELSELHQRIDNMSAIIMDLQVLVKNQGDDQMRIVLALAHKPQEVVDAVQELCREIVDKPQYADKGIG